MERRELKTLPLKQKNICRGLWNSAGELFKRTWIFLHFAHNQWFKDRATESPITNGNIVWKSRGFGEILDIRPLSWLGGSVELGFQSSSASSAKNDSQNSGAIPSRSFFASILDLKRTSSALNPPSHERGLLSHELLVKTPSTQLAVLNSLMAKRRLL